MSFSFRTLLVALALGGVWQSAVAAPPEPAELAATIDRHLALAWDDAGVKPSETIDDATFLRRIYLDLVGRIPTVAEARAFLNDSSADKRTKLTEQLIQSGGHARHFATVWRRAWIPQADTPEFDNLTEDFENWMSVRLRDNVPYDRLVKELLTVPRGKWEGEMMMPAEGKARGGNRVAVSPAGFLAASQFKPELLAANTTRAFLGLNLDCAQCHDHPFSRWTRDQFWQTAAFFVAPSISSEAATMRLQINIPEKQRTLEPMFLDGHAPTLPPELTADSGRLVLAEWVTSRENPYFARNAVNRTWAAVFGWGLVEPLDDLSDENPPAHPELLAEVTAAFVASGYDLNYLTRSLVLSRAYQLAPSPPPSPEEQPVRVFNAMPVRGLTGEQLYDSLRVASGRPVERRDLLDQRPTNDRAQFAARMLISRPVDAERSITQSLSLMNGPLTVQLTTPATSPTLATVVEAPFLNAHEKIEVLYLATLSRKPTNDESSRLVNYLESGGDERPAAEALADIFWSLLNSSEFNTNH